MYKDNSFIMRLGSNPIVQIFESSTSFDQEKYYSVHHGNRKEMKGSEKDLSGALESSYQCK